MPEACLTMIFKVMQRQSELPRNILPLWWRACDADAASQTSIMSRPPSESPVHMFADINEKTPASVRARLDDIEQDTSMPRRDL